MLVALAYGYLLSAFIGLAWTRLRRRADQPPCEPPTVQPQLSASGRAQHPAASLDRKSQPHRRAAAGRTLDLDRAAVQLDVPLRDREAQARSRGTRREVGLEQPRRAPRRPCRRRYRRPRSPTASIGARVVTSSGVPPARHRVQRVLDHVDERAAEQLAVERHERQVRRASVVSIATPVRAARPGTARPPRR